MLYEVDDGDGDDGKMVFVEHEKRRRRRDGKTERGHSARWKTTYRQNVTKFTVYIYVLPYIARWALVSLKMAV